MKLNLSHLMGSFGCLGMAASLAVFTPQVSLAQTTNNPLQDWQQQGNPNDISNIFNNSNSSGSLGSMMNLLNRIQMLSGSSYDPADLQESLNSEAEAFRNRQKQQMELQFVPSPVPPQPQPQ